MLFRLAKYCLLASVCAILIVMPSVFFPFIGGKYWFFRFCVELAAVFTLLGWAFQDVRGEFEKKIKSLFKNPLVLAVTIFTGAFLLATIFSYDPATSFWSNYERGEGGFQMLHYYAFFLLLAALFRDRSDWQRMFQISLGAAVFMVLYGFGAAVGWKGYVGPYAAEVGPTAGFFKALFNARFQGSLGNAVYVGPYLLFSFGYLSWLLSTAKHARVPITLLGAAVAGAISVYSISLAFTLGNGALLTTGYVTSILCLGLFGLAIQTGYSVGQALIGFGLGCLYFLAFFCAQSRGALVGLGIALVAGAVYVVCVNKHLRSWTLGLLGSLIVLGGVLYSARHNPFILSLPGSRLLDINVSSGNAETRIWSWEIAWKGFKDRPIFGYGPENFPVIYDKYFNPKFFIPEGREETWFDRAHSVVFDYLAETGFVGLLSYLAIFVTFGWTVIRASYRALRRPISERHLLQGSFLEWGIATALVVSYLIQGIFAFDVLPMFLNFLLVLAFTVWATSPHLAKPEPSHPKK